MAEKLHVEIARDVFGWDYREDWQACEAGEDAILQHFYAFFTEPL